MTNQTPPPFAALHEPWGCIKALLVLVTVAILSVLLAIGDLVRGRPASQHAGTPTESGPAAGS
ncbi:hypothetical protein F3087_34205 [Nocardia colli]|uniref:Uncharacterized protein n=1 Tax=Nocardia colli TaxID=2545717 RepID=A0A5N0E779_9NOCA|nr:hypothetical protein [Nocardia colli]KAA8884279.1 hypothetical protein F3087_34205 [Nocardia colli]